MELDKMDELLSTVCKTEYDNINQIKQISVPDINEMMKKFEESLSKDSVNRTLHFSIIPEYLKGKAAFMICVLLFSIALSMVYEIPRVRAFKFNVIKTFVEVTDSIIKVKHIGDTTDAFGNSSSDSGIRTLISPDDARKKLPFHMLEPEFLPEGYKLAGIEWIRHPSDIHVVNQKYVKNQKQMIDIRQTENIKDVNVTINVNPELANVKIANIDGNEITLILKRDAGDPLKVCSAQWYRNNSRFQVIGTVSEEELTNIIKGMK